MISAIVLAAGRSDRMGRPKQLLPWNDTTVIHHICDVLLCSPIGEVIVVLGHQADRVRRALPSSGLRTVALPDAGAPMIVSVQHGIRAASDEARGFMIVLGDQPGITIALVESLVSNFWPGPKQIIIPTHHAKRGHPVVLHARLKDEILAVRETGTLRDVIHAHPDNIRHVEVHDPALLADIDTEEDYARLTGQSPTTPAA